MTIFEKRLLELAKELEIVIDSPRRYLDPDDYLPKVTEKAKYLIGYIMSLKDN